MFKKKEKNSQKIYHTRNPDLNKYMKKILKLFTKQKNPNLNNNKIVSHTNQTGKIE